MKSANIEISSNTCAVSYKTPTSCEIIDEKTPSRINLNLQEYINYNCEYYGSSFEGRRKGSQSILGMKYKLPIIIEESRELIFFPTSAYDKEDCSWISLKNILSYEKAETKTVVTFKNGQIHTFNISIYSFENQMLRANRLLLILKTRKQR